jgi:hypothetical protein
MRRSFFTDWTLQTLFDRPIEKSCPVALRSNIRVILPDSSFELTPVPHNNDAEFYLYNVNTGKCATRAISS